MGKTEVKIKICPNIGDAYAVLIKVPDEVIQGGTFAIEEFIDKWVQDHATNVTYWEIDNA